MRLPQNLLASALLLPLVAGCFAQADEEGNRATGRIRVALAVPPSQALSPYSNDATVLSKLSVAEGLTRLDADGIAQPALASSYRKADATTWTFDLREASFQDGTKVTAESVVNALSRAAKAAPKPRVLSGVDLTATATDADTVQIKTSTADPVLPLRLASPALGILSAAAYKADGTVSPVGTASGPFRIVRLDGKTGATLDRFDGYWGGTAKAAGLDVSWIADGTARANALRSGSVDVAEWIPISQAKLVDPGSLHEVSSVRTDSLLLNTAKGVFADAKARAAARGAVDGSDLVSTVFGGYADAAQGLFGPAVSWAAGLRVPAAAPAASEKVSGKTITLAAYTNRAELPEAATVLQQQLEKAGFTVKQDVREYSQMEADLLAGKYDALVLSRVVLLDTGDPVAYLASDYAAKGAYNLTGLSDGTVDAAIATAAAEADPERRKAAVIKAEAAVLGTDAVIPLVHERVLQGISPKVTGVILDPRERSLVDLNTSIG
jgi:peptide/nickel transport system substrate-binding protein